MNLSLALTDTSRPRHPIQVVARRTGLSVDAIRAWERRYGAVVPYREANGRRLYSDDDVERLDLLSRAVQGGRRIGDIATLEAESLRELVEDDQRRSTPAPVDNVPASPPNSASGHLAQCRKAVSAMNGTGLERALGDAAAGLPLQSLLTEVVLPLLYAIGDDWQAGRLRVGQEHMASHVIRGFLGSILSTANLSGTGPGLLATTPAGQQHEFGALMAAILAAANGWRVTYLAPDLPASDIAAAALERVRVVALGITYPPDDVRLGEELRRLRRALPDTVDLVVGGACTGAYTATLNEIGALRVQQLSEWPRTLQQLRGNAPRPR